MAKQEGGKTYETFPFKIRKHGIERTNVGGVSVRDRNGAPSRKGVWSMVK